MYSDIQLQALLSLLDVDTVIYRKGAEVTEQDHADSGVRVVHVFGYPHVDEAREPTLVDCHFVVVGVREITDAHRAQFMALFDAYPEPERLAGGPSYIEVGGVLGSQDAAFQMFAVGQALGLWEVITPRRLLGEGASDAEADTLAGNGLVLCSGYRREEVPA